MSEASPADTPPTTPPATVPAPATTSASSGPAKAETPALDPEPLREDEEADAELDAQALELVRQHKQRLEAMPDGRRPAAPGTSRPGWRRRTYIVDWKIQLSYAGLYVATLTLFIVGFAASNLIFRGLVQLVRTNQRVPHVSWLQDEDRVYYLILNFVVLLFVGMGMALWAIVHSHRIAGPALRFRRSFRQLIRRDYDFYLQLRKRDYLQELAEQVNVLNNALKAKDVIVSDAALRVDEIARSLGDPKKADELREIARDLADVVLPLPEPAPEVEAESVTSV